MIKMNKIRKNFNFNKIGLFFKAQNINSSNIFEYMKAKKLYMKFFIILIK